MWDSLVLGKLTKPRMKQTIIIFLFITLCISCKERPDKTDLPQKKESRIENLIANLENSKNKEVIVVAHRGDWRNSPENSLQAIQSCIDMGVDMVEIDIRETKDGHLVLMHDNTIDRTTNGSGFLNQWTLDSLKTLNLKDKSGVVTAHKIPTLEEALILSKNKILVNLDKSYSIIDKCYQIAESTGTVSHVVVKGSKSLSEVRNDFGKYLDKIHFMPVVHLPQSNNDSIVEDYLTNFKPVAIEFIFKQDSVSLIQEFKDIRKNGTGIWVNALWASLNGGHTDEKAVLDPSIYDWYIDNGVDIIQTDRPRLLIQYLRKRGLHQ